MLIIKLTIIEFNENDFAWQAPCWPPDPAQIIDGKTSSPWISLHSLSEMTGTVTFWRTSDNESESESVKPHPITVHRSPGLNKK